MYALGSIREALRSCFWIPLEEWITKEDQSSRTIFKSRGTVPYGVLSLNKVDIRDDNEVISNNLPLNSIS